MALLPQDQQSKVMLLITIAMVGLGWGFWTYWEQPTGQQIDAARVEIDSLQRIVDRAKQDLASGTVEDLRRKVEEYTDRKSTRLNSSHGYISYAVFCLKKKKNSIHVNQSPHTNT